MNSAFRCANSSSMRRLFASAVGCRSIIWTSRSPLRISWSSFSNVRTPGTANSVLPSIVSVESEPSAKRPSIEPSGESNVLVNFAPLPKGDILPFDDTKAIRTDFNVKEYISSKSNLLITDQVKTIYQELQRNDSPFTLLLHGASGVGKTMTLLLVGHMARKSGCLVFPIQAKKFVNQTRPLSKFVHNFLSKWSRAVGEEFLEQIPCQITTFSNLSDLVKQGLSDEKEAISCFENLVDELRYVVDVPVVFLIDQCNAFYTKHTLQIFPDDEIKVVEPGSRDNPIACLFVGWNDFEMERGCILYAFSSSFNLMPLADDGNSSLFRTLKPMKVSEFTKLVELSVNEGHLSNKLLDTETIEELFDLSAGIPRELQEFTLAWKSSGESDFNFTRVKLAYLKNRRKFYLYRIKRLFNKEKMGTELVKASVLFACRVFIGRPMEDVPQIWEDAGLVTSDESGVYQLICPAAADALLTSIDHDVMREAVSIFRSDPNMRWRALELGVVYAFRQAIVSGDSVVLECTKLDGESPTKLKLKVNNIVHSESEPPISGLPRGTMFVCPVGSAVVDFFIHDLDGQKIALQVSESPYIEHKSKYPDFEMMKEDYRNVVNDDNASEIQYVYLTTARQKMRKNGKHYNEQVLLFSNINNGVTRFFKGLITPVDSNS